LISQIQNLLSDRDSLQFLVDQINLLLKYPHDIINSIKILITEVESNKTEAQVDFDDFSDFEQNELRMISEFSPSSNDFIESELERKLSTS
jgi:hypothetical protein